MSLLPLILPSLTLTGLAPEVFLNAPTTRDDIILEIVKVIGIAISAGASSFALYIANRNRKSTADISRDTRAIKVQQQKRRRQVRHEDTPDGEPSRVVIEEHDDGSSDGASPKR